MSEYKLELSEKERNDLYVVIDFVLQDYDFSGDNGDKQIVLFKLLEAIKK